MIIEINLRFFNNPYWEPMLIKQQKRTFRKHLFNHKRTWIQKNLLSAADY